MARYVRVRDKKRGIEREITQYAYKIMPSRYDLISGNPAITQPTVKKSENGDVNPVAAGDPITADQLKQRKKPGPKPKNQQNA